MTAAAGVAGVAADAVVVAAGASVRMGGLDKMLVPVAGRPLLAWTLAAIASASVVRRVVVVAAPDRADRIAAAPWLPSVVCGVVRGGARRQDSVAAGVAALGEGAPGDVILVHDGARPLVSAALVEQVTEAAAAHGAAIPVLAVAETVKQVTDGRVVGTVERDGLWTAQTPQGVRRDVLARAWAERPPAGPAVWTDEASLLEACRIPVHAVPGEPTNLKVTLPDDLARVRAAIAARDDGPGDGAPCSAPLRVGFGDDGHVFGPGSPLVLGGIVIEGAPRLHGHSDGDVALHAVCDALLGAAGLGDLGRHFPAGPATPEGIASGALVTACVAKVRAAGFRPASLDLTIIGGRPRLGGRLDEMAAAVADLVGLPATRVTMKASTGNLLGFEGAGRGITARAVAVVVEEPFAGEAGT